MARVFVTNEKQTVRVEVEQGAIDGEFSAFCSHCGPTSNLFEDGNEPNGLGDAVEWAGAHADSCG